MVGSVFSFILPTLALNLGHHRWVYLTVQTLDLLSAAVGQILSRVVDGGEKQLGVGQQGVSPLQVSPQLLLHVEVSVSHLPGERDLVLTLR